MRNARCCPPLQAFVLALEHPAAAGEVFNGGSGVDRSVRDVAKLLAIAMGKNAIEPAVAGEARASDIRHCIADIGKIQRELGYAPKCDFMAGLAELAAWVAEQQTSVDRVYEARDELEARGLVA